MFEKIEKYKKISDEYITIYLIELSRQERKSLYEKLCEISGKILPIKYENKKLAEQIIFSNLVVFPNEVISFSLLSFLFSFLLSVVLYNIFPDIGFLFFSIPILISYLIYSYPSFKAQVNKIQTGSEVLKIILYLCIYLEMNPSLEGAFDFASKRVKGIISNDIKKIVWGVKTGKYPTLRHAIERYIPKWLKWNENFVRTLLLISNIPYIVKESERKETIRRALNFMLEKNYEETKKYVEEIISPITLIFMFGLLMPSIGLVMFPMLSIFLHQTIKPSYLVIGYTVILPFFNLFLIRRLIAKRPGAFLVPDISKHPELPPYGKFFIKVKDYKILFPILPISILLFLLVASYSILHLFDLYYKISTAPESLREEIMKKESEMIISTPKGWGINLQLLFAGISFPLGLSLAFISYFYLNSFQRVKIRKEVKDVEDDLPQLLNIAGNFLMQGYPLEKVVEKTLEEYERMGMKEKAGYKLFTLLKQRLTSTQQSLKEILFGKDGIIKRFPSPLLEECFKIMIESAYKSSKILGNIVKSIGKYLENLKSSELRLKELLATVRNNLRMQSRFLIPIITGIVSATGIFIINMLKYLADMLSKLEKSFGLIGRGTLTSAINILVGDFSKVIPLSLYQIVLGVYTLESITLMAYILSGIESGFDRIARDWEIFDALKIGILIYFILSFLSLFLFANIMISLKGFS